MQQTKPRHRGTVRQKVLELRRLLHCWRLGRGCVLGPPLEPKLRYHEPDLDYRVVADLVGVQPRVSVLWQWTDVRWTVMLRSLLNDAAIQGRSRLLSIECFVVACS